MLAALLLATMAGCASGPQAEPASDAARAPSRPVAAATISQADRARAEAAIRQAAARVALARKARPDFVSADLPLARARAALGLGSGLGSGLGAADRAIRLAQDAERQADALVLSEYERRARIYRERARRYTGLSEAQSGVLRRADQLLARGDYRQAYRTLKAFDLATREAERLYTVRSGDTLQTIAARPDVYANARLWPLIYEANLELVKDPNVLQAGWELKIRAHPRLQQVYAAIERSRAGRGSVSVGPVQRVD